MEESDDFKLAVKVVIKRQMKDLMEQLRERGEEIAVLTVDLEDNSYSHFGSPNGEWFLSQQKNIPQSFLSFCQSNTNQVASQTTVTAVSPKKKSIASLRSASKQNTSTEVPEVRVTVPKKLAGDLSEEEVAALVGRIVATHLAFQEKGDGSSSGTQFDVLLKTANQSKHKGNSSIFATPRSARKRKPTAKFMEGMSSLKKGRKIDDEETNEMEVGNEEMFGLLSELSNTVLRRVKVTVPNNKTINLEKSSLDTSETTEALAVYIIQELDAVCGSQLANRNSIKVVVSTDAMVEEVNILSDHTYTTVDIKPSFSELSANININIDNLFNDGDCAMEGELPKEVTAIIEKENGTSSNEAKKSIVRPRPRKNNWKLPHACKICGKLIFRTNNLRAHIRRVHMKEKKYHCDICFMSFFSSTATNTHKLGVHARRCSACNQYVYETKPWDSGTSKITKRFVKCQCGNDVNMASAIGRTREYESTSVRVLDADFTQFACEYCGKLFSQKHQCKRHAKIHTFDIPTHNVDTPTHTVDIPTHTVDTPTHTFDIPTHTVDIPTHTVNIQTHDHQSSVSGVSVDIDKDNDNMLNDGDSDMEEEMPDKVTAVVEEENKLLSNEVKTPVVKRRPRQNNWKLRHACKICGKFIYRTNNLNAHVRRVHMNEKRHECGICFKRFYTKSDINSHKLSIHSKRCTSCDQYVMETKTWDSGTNNLTERFVKCKCGNDVNMASVIGRKRDNDEGSVRVVDADFPQFICEYCGKIFSQKSKCVRHTKIHTGEKDYECKLCGERYARKESLKKHLASIHNVYEHQCELCSEKFNSMNDLETHKEIHCSQSYEDQQQLIVLSQESASCANDETLATSTISATESATETCTVLLDDTTCNIVDGLQQYTKDDTIFIIESFDPTQ